MLYSSHDKKKKKPQTYITWSVNRRVTACDKEMDLNIIGRRQDPNINGPFSKHLSKSHFF